MFLAGDFVKIIDGIHKGEIGKIENYDGHAFYHIKLYKTGQMGKYTEDEIEKVNPIDIDEAVFKVKVDDSLELKLKNSSVI